MRIGVIGINHKLANIHLRELLAQACQRCFSIGGSFHMDHTVVLLSTCNRTEIYFSSPDLAETHSYLLQILRQEITEDFDQKIYSYFSQDCFLHLSRVTAGLDSAIVAETEIQGQVKSAYEQAARCMTLPSELHYLFQKALKIGKKVRTDLPMGQGMPNLEHAVLNAGKQFFSSLTVPQPKVLFVGASDINCKILEFLKSKKMHDITVCNRSRDRAESAASTYEVSILDWSQLKTWPQFDWIIFGTKSPHPLIHRQEADLCVSRKLIIDLSVPHNVDPKLRKDGRISLLNIDQINRTLKFRKKQMATLLKQAEGMISKYSELYYTSKSTHSEQTG